MKTALAAAIFLCMLAVGVGLLILGTGFDGFGTGIAGLITKVGRAIQMYPTMAMIYVLFCFGLVIAILVMMYKTEG